MSARLLRRVVVALIAVLLASCSAMRFAYNNAQGLVRFEADLYFDFDEAQEADFRERLARVFDWHREAELPAYAALLREAHDRMQRGVGAPDVRWAIDAMRVRYHAGIRQAIAEAAPMLASLRERQFRTLEKKLAEGNRKIEKEFLSGDPRRAQRNRFKRLRERFSDWMGDLSDEQEARIERFVREHTRYSVLRFEDRKRLQRDAVALMRQHRDAAALEAPLAALFVAPAGRRSAEYLEVAAQWEADLAELIAELDRMATREQRARVASRIAELAEDLSVLAGERAASRTVAGSR